MKNSYLDLEKIGEKVLEVLEQFDIRPVTFGVVISLKPEEFDNIASQHPDHNQPNLILKRVSESNRPQ